MATTTVKSFEVKGKFIAEGFKFYEERFYCLLSILFSNSFL